MAQAQTQPTQPTQPETIQRKVGDRRKFPNGNVGMWDGMRWEQVAPNNPQQLFGGTLGQSGQNPSEAITSFTPNEVLKGILSLLTGGSQFIPGVNLPSMALRTGLYSLGEGAKGGIDGGWEGAKQGAQTGAMTAVAGEAGGKFIPQILDTTALALGAARAPMETAGALARENANRGRFTKLAVGNQPGAEKTAAKVGETLRGVEKATPGTVPTSDFGGSVDSLIKDQRVDRAGVQLRKSTQRAEDAFVKDKTKLYGDDLSMSDVGELYRARQQDARSLITKRRDKLPISPKDEQLGKIDSALGERGKYLYNKMDVTGQAKPLNQRLSDLHLIREENRKMGNNAHVLAPLAMLGRRAAGGAMAGGALAYSQGEPISSGSTTGAITGLFMSPSNISRLGMLLGRTASAVPTILEGKDLLENPAMQQILDELKKRSGK